MCVSHLAKSIDTALHSSSTPHPSNRRLGQSWDSSSVKHVCDDCLRKGHVRHPINGWEHCEHNHCAGGGRQTQGVDNKLDTERAMVTNPKPKAMVLTAALETLDEDNDKWSDDAVTLSVNVGNHNESASLYVGLDCFPESPVHSRPATALLTNDPVTLSELQSVFQALLDSALHLFHLFPQ